MRFRTMALWISNPAPDQLPPRRSIKRSLKRAPLLGVIGLYLLVTILFFFYRIFTLTRTLVASKRALRVDNGVTTRTQAVGCVEIWARGPAKSAAASALRDLAGPDLTRQLRSLCGRCLYRTLTSYVRAQDHGRFTVVLTGDIPAVWLRDSAIQMATYIPRVAQRPALRPLIEGAIRAQAYFILQVQRLRQS